MMQELIDFIRNEIGEYKMEITESTLIEDDIGVTGDDGVDLIKRFSKHYNVDISEFIYSDYFYPEGVFFISKEMKIKPLTIKDLENAILKGKLV